MQPGASWRDIHIIAAKCPVTFGICQSRLLKVSWEEWNSLEEAHFHKCLLDTNLHCTETLNLKELFQLLHVNHSTQWEWGKVVWSRHRHNGTQAPPTCKETRWRIEVERRRRLRVEGCESQTCNFSWQLDGTHLHSLMHDSSPSLYYSAKHYIYFTNANLW